MKMLLLFFLLPLVCFSSENANSVTGEVAIRPYGFYPASEKLLYMERALSTGQIIAGKPSFYIGLQDSFLNDLLFRKRLENIPYYDTITEYGDISNICDPYSVGIDWNASLRPTSQWERMFPFNGDIFLQRNGLRLEIKKNEVVGTISYLWDLDIWKFFEYEYPKRKRPLFIAAAFPYHLFTRGRTSEQCYQRMKDNAQILSMTEEHYNRALKRKKFFDSNSSSRFKSIQLFNWPKEKSKQIYELLKESSQLSKDSVSQSTYIPLMVIDPDHHNVRIDKNDWRIHTFLNINNGDFFQYFFFEKEFDYEWPLYMRDCAMDHLGGVHVCKKSTVSLILSDDQKIISLDSKMQFSNPKILFSYSKGKRHWRPEPVPYDKNSIDFKRCFYAAVPGQIFGSYSKIWELGIWHSLGVTLKKNPEAEVYLVGYGTLLQAAETKTVEEEHALIKKCGVKITPMMYQMFDRMGKQSKD